MDRWSGPWPELAVLDVAGTTLDVGDVVPGAFRAALEPLGIEADDAMVAAVRGRSKREAIAALIGSAGPARADLAAATAAAWDRFGGEMALRLGDAVRPIPGAAETLAWLRATVGPVWLTSGFDRATLDRVLCAVGWDGLDITGTLSGDDVARGRPAPDLLRAAMARAGVRDPRRVLVVGDTVADLDAAAAAGADCVVGVLSGAHERSLLEARPHAVLLASVAELPSWLAPEPRAGTTP